MVHFLEIDIFSLSALSFIIEFYLSFIKIFAKWI